jgi:hypothetical protein
MLAASKPSFMKTLFAPSIICSRFAGSSPAAKRPAGTGSHLSSFLVCLAISMPFFNLFEPSGSIALDMCHRWVYVKLAEPIGSMEYDAPKTVDTR